MDIESVTKNINRLEKIHDEIQNLLKEALNEVKEAVAETDNPVIVECARYCSYWYDQMLVILEEENMLSGNMCTLHMTIEEIREDINLKKDCE